MVGWKKKVFPRQGVIDLYSRQINIFFNKNETEKIEFVARPGGPPEVGAPGATTTDPSPHSTRPRADLQGVGEAEGAPVTPGGTRWPWRAVGTAVEGWPSSPLAAQCLLGMVINPFFYSFYCHTECHFKWQLSFHITGKQ